MAYAVQYSQHLVGLVLIAPPAAQENGSDLRNDELFNAWQQTGAPSGYAAWGAKDCFTGVAPVKALSELFSSGRLATIENCGHYPWIEQPDAFRQAVDPFIDASC